jgi:protein NrfD
MGVALVAVSGWLYAGRSGGGLVAYLIPVSFLFSSLILGSALLGMLLGHRYLTNPHLPMSHLNFLARVFLIAVSLQGGLTVATFWFGLSSEVAFAALRLESVLGLFLWIRLAIGIVGPLVLAVMILNTIRYQANMSATGLLYIAVIMVMAGEAFSRYLLLAESILL